MSVLSQNFINDFNDKIKLMIFLNNTWDEETIRVPGEIVIGFRFGLLREKII